MMGNWLTRQDHPSTTVCDARHTTGTSTEDTSLQGLAQRGGNAAARRQLDRLVAVTK
jgi:hypothetical protein